MTWREFRELTKNIPDDESIFFNVNTCCGYFGVSVDKENPVEFDETGSTINLMEVN